LYDGGQVLTTRRKVGQWWVPAAPIEFAWYLARAIVKDRLDSKTTQRLSRLYKQDPAGCAQELQRHWRPETAGILRAAAASMDWDGMRQKTAELWGELRRRAIAAAPIVYVTAKLHSLAQRLVSRERSISVVLLGPDGAGKSSVIRAMQEAKNPLFVRSRVSGFAPSLRQLMRRPVLPSDEPHGLALRSRPTSVIRAAYWAVFAVIDYSRVRLAHMPTLVLYDRHFMDILVDPKRYRYGGPQWLLTAIWKLSPKPDLVILLDAPAEVLQARKQEVPFEMTVRHRRDYRALTAQTKRAHVVNVDRPLLAVVADVTALINQHVSRQIGLRPGPVTITEAY
jgi:thymidylate kinase